MERAGVAVDALQLFVKLKYYRNSYIHSLKADIYSATLLVQELSSSPTLVRHPR